MRALRGRSGSALIIVLGFLSFMVVSAVAFAVYMRTERLASSGFHRSASVRQMVKAGVANAIAQIDAAIGDDPYPGLQTGGSSGGDFGLNHWRNCLFMPYKYAPADETVPVIPLEGLAYLPPALVNEVRAGARNTYSAQWQNLDYDVGRFAYLAVNVSDFFDVNKVHFGTSRNTGPGGRVALAYLFQNRQGTSLDVSASQLRNVDEFLKTRGGGESQVPFVSLADFNVALFKADASGSRLGVYSPFYNYLKGGKARAFYSQGGDEAEDLVEKAGRMMFVTDSWQVPTNKTDEVIDLALDEDQPFRKTAFSDSKNVGTLLQATGRAYDDRLKNELSITTMANLYDYLDDNSVPISLAIPNVERVPMVGVVNASMVSGMLEFSVTKKSEDSDYTKGGAGQGQTYIKTTTTYSLEPKAGALPPVNIVGVYPFKGKSKREGETAQKSYKVQLVMKIFFTKPGSDGGGQWSGRCFQTTRITPTRNEWNNENSAKVDNNCITLVSRKTQISNFPSEVFEEKEAFFDAMVQLPSLANLNADLTSKFLLETQRLYRKNNFGQKGAEVTDVDNFPKATTFKLLPFSSSLPKAEGGLVVGPVSTGDAQTEVKLAEAKCWGMTLTPHIAVWARILDDQDKTVDLAPASMFDDELIGGVGGAYAQAFINIAGDGSAYTPMLAAEGKPVVFSKENWSVGFEGVDSETPVKLFDGSASAFAALDPRFNHSPEDFIAKVNGLTKDGYLQEIQKLLGHDGRDPDIFMFASDQQYLQSIGELAFLPKLGELGDTTAGLYAKCSTPLPFKSDFNQLDARMTHRESFWRTYPLFRQKDDGYADEDYLFSYFSSQIEAGDKIIANDVNGFKVNPYSQIEKIRLAVTANTPHSYWASSTNTLATNNRPPCFNGPGQPKAMDECLKYCFNQMTGNVGPELAWRDVTNITERVFSRMRSDALDRKDWESSLASMDWCSAGDGSFDPGVIFDYELDGASDDLSSVDRKTLYSFWHDSMANRQQLFLVFVRVEAIPLGASDNGSADVLPPQHGARAVALVWRDPNPQPGARKVQWRNQEGGSNLFGCSLGEGSSYAPHRTRLLFYHQFD